MTVSQRYVKEVLTAVVHRGKESSNAGLQFQINGKIEQGFVIEAAHKNRPLRLCVGEPGCRSTVWRIWAHRNASDVYIASSTTAHAHKISIHESGDWRYQSIRPIAELLDSNQVGLVELENEVTSRVLGSWRRPSSPEHGWIDVMRIVVPTSEVIPHPNTYGDLQSNNKIQWVSPAPPGFATEIRFFLVQPGKGIYGLNEAVIQEGGLSYWGGMTLPSGEVLVVLSSTFEVEPDLRAHLKAIKKHGPVRGKFDGSYENAPRILTTEMEPNYATFWDLAGYR